MSAVEHVLLQVFMRKLEINRLQTNTMKQSGNFICNLSCGNMKTFIIQKSETVALRTLYACLVVERQRKALINP